MCEGQSARTFCENGFQRGCKDQPSGTTRELGRTRTTIHDLYDVRYTLPYSQDDGICDAHENGKVSIVHWVRFCIFFFIFNKIFKRTFLLNVLASLNRVQNKTKCPVYLNTLNWKLPCG